MKFLSNLKRKNLSGKTCLLRVDFNIEKEELKKIRGNRNIPLRIERILPSIRFLLKNGSNIVILSHRGRPKLVKRANKELRIKNSEFSLKPFTGILSKLIKKPVKFVDFQKGFNPEKIKKIISVGRGKIFLLENLRFLAGEEKNDVKFAKELASLGDFYVNDAFSVSHRANASIAAITKSFSSYAGFSMKEELVNLSKITKKPKKPFVFIFGGVKISDKIGLIKNFMGKANYFLIGGGMANTFFAAESLPIGKSLYEKNKLAAALKISKSPKIILPVDVNVRYRKILDIGLETMNKYSQIIKRAKTVVWNGPMGYIEEPEFRHGSEAIAEAILKSSAYSIVGGGETASLFIGKKEKENVFISTGGGAMLEYLAGKKLPGIIALNNKKNNG